MKEKKEVQPLDKRQLTIKIVLMAVVGIILCVSIYFAIYNYIMCITLQTDGKTGGILQLLVTLPTIFINTILSVLGFIFSIVGMRNKTKWIKIVYITFLVLFIAIIIATIVGYLMVIGTLKA